jgi:hypothetical protein
MKIGIVSPRGHAGTIASIPHGLLQIAAQTKATGHQVDIFDFVATPPPRVRKSARL